METPGPAGLPGPEQGYLAVGPGVAEAAELDLAAVEAARRAPVAAGEGQELPGLPAGGRACGP